MSFPTPDQRPLKVHHRLPHFFQSPSPSPSSPSSSSSSSLPPPPHLIRVRTLEDVEDLAVLLNTHKALHIEITCTLPRLAFSRISASSTPVVTEAIIKCRSLMDRPSPTATAFLCALLAQCKSTLTALDLEDFEVLDDQVWSHLSALKLTHLGLDSTYPLGDWPETLSSVPMTSAEYLFAPAQDRTVYDVPIAMSLTSSLTHLNLSKLTLSESTLKTLGTHLRTTRSLTSLKLGNLSLDGSRRVHSPLNEILQALYRNKSVMYLSLQVFELDSEALDRSIVSMGALKCITLEDCTFQNKATIGLNSLLRAAAQSTTVEVVDVSELGGKVTTTVANIMAKYGPELEAMRTLRGLKTLDVKATRSGTSHENGSERPSRVSKPKIEASPPTEGMAMPQPMEIGQPAPSTRIPDSTPPLDSEDEKAKAELCKILRGAVLAGHWNKAIAALRNGANAGMMIVDDDDKQVWQVLHWTVETAINVKRGSGQLDCIKALVQGGADVDAPGGTDGCTALHLACRTDQPDVAKLLLFLGADPSIKDVRGRTPLHYCPESSKCIPLLKNHVLSPNRSHNNTARKSSIRMHSGATSLSPSSSSSMVGPLRLGAPAVLKYKPCTMDEMGTDVVYARAQVASSSEVQAIMDAKAPSTKTAKPKVKLVDELFEFEGKDAWVIRQIESIFSRPDNKPDPIDELLEIGIIEDETDPVFMAAKDPVMQSVYEGKAHIPYGVFCKHTRTEPLRAGTVLGEYTGELLVDRFIDIADLREKLKRVYDMSFKTVKEWDGHQQVVLDALKYRSHLGFINDFRDLNDRTKDRQQNCSFKEVTVNGWPHVMVVTTQAIYPADQLLIDYSEDYWADIKNQYGLFKWHLDELNRLKEKLTKEFDEKLAAAMSKVQPEVFMLD
mmetsp:Transcript_34218/g.57458  ORF Transcript_34218/g.57458 Transcript_34218/m.57458 type:complete len:895 (-) Transcript_34218:258-2942(-)